jgi:predicted ATP-grasp superfamily ATP-dependent carboligase
VGNPRLGASGFQYCGSLLATPATPLFPDQEQLLDRAMALVATVTREFRLTGLNGIDFIARNGVPYPVEVNPRYSASMELIERNAGLSLFEVHARAAEGELPPPPALSPRVHGKVIVFARHKLRVGDTRSWLARSWLADVPHPGERILRGHPICTVLAKAGSGPVCLRLLLQRAAGIYRTLEFRRRRAA